MIVTVPPDTTPSTVASLEAPKFVAVCGDQPWVEGSRLLKLVMLAAVGVAAVRSLFGSEKIETRFVGSGPASSPWMSRKSFVPITTEFPVTPRVGKSAK